MNSARATCIALLLFSIALEAQFASTSQTIIQGLPLVFKFHPLRDATFTGGSLDIFDPASVLKFKLKTLAFSSEQLSPMQKGSETEKHFTFDTKGRITNITIKYNNLYSTYWECVYDDDVYGKETRYMLYKDQEPYLTCESTYGQTGFLVHKKYTWTWREGTKHVYAFPVSEEMFSYDGEHRMAKYIFQHENKQQTIQLQFTEKGFLVLKRKEITKIFQAIEGVNEEETRDLLETTEQLTTYEYESDYSQVIGITSDLMRSAKANPLKSTTFIHYRYDEKGNVTELESKGESADIYSKELMSYNPDGEVVKTELWGPHNKLVGTYRMEYKTHKNEDREQWTTFITDAGNTNSRAKCSKEGLLVQYVSENSDYNSETKKTLKTTYEIVLDYTYWN